MAKLLWTPSKQRISEANLSAFTKFLSEQNIFHAKNYFSLYEWSIAEAAKFWEAFSKFSKIIYSKPHTSVVEGGENVFGARWFPGAELNFAENLLRYRDDKLALIFANELGQRRTLTYAELYQQVAALAAYLKSIGVAKGDRVAGLVPNLPESVVAMLATTSIGAIWSSCSPDFGLKGICERFDQIQPKVLFAADGYYYNGKQFDSLARVIDLQTQIPSIEQTVLIPYLAEKPALQGLIKTVLYRDANGSLANAKMEFTQVPFAHPLYILYSSGTTGIPKCIVHSTGGTLLQHLKELSLHTDVKREDRIFYFSTCGWMMWNWLVSSLALGATVILYDGAPMAPSSSAMFDFIDREQITIFGTSAKFLQAAEKEGLRPQETHSLKSLKTILSTGSPLLPESFDYVYQAVKADVCLSSISGGTDIVSCFVLGCPVESVYRGQCQTRGLGLKVEIYDQDNKPVTGRPGELICSAPFPAMPIGFWNDSNNERYKAAYFEAIPGVWRHGDWAELTAEGGVIIYGRSDAVLNPGGVRIGTAEIYSSVERIAEVRESLVVGQTWQGDERVVLFVQLSDGAQLDENLQQKIKTQIRNDNTPRHVPAKIIAVPAIPRTISGKVVELAVKNIIHGRAVKNSDALANPEALEYFKNLPALST